MPPSWLKSPEQNQGLTGCEERAALQAQLKAHRGSRAELARKLGISERSLYRKLRDFDREPPA
ncbi:MAG: helix-turn-helix domain-containing protein [Burkholderiales bacterium]